MILSIVLIIAIGLAWYVLRRQEGSISGKPKIIDGDTVDISGQRFRLDGFDALEMGQDLIINGRRINGGKAAKEALSRYLRGKAVSVELVEGKDRWGRALGRLYADGEDVGAWMVSKGLAVVDPRYDRRYQWREKAARLAKRGIWKGRFVMPWKWRKGERLGRKVVWLDRLVIPGKICLVIVAVAAIVWLMFR